MTTVRDVLTRVKAITGAYARRANDLALAALDDHDELLGILAETGMSEIARETSRVRATAVFYVSGGQQEFPAAEVWLPVSCVFKTEGGPAPILQKIDGFQARAMAGLEIAGMPSRYGIFQKRMWLDRASPVEGTIELDHVSLWWYDRAADDPAPAMTVDEVIATDTVPPELIDLLVDYLVSEWYKTIGEHKESAIIRERYRSHLAAARSDPQMRSIVSRKLRSF
jgi:hypothetical protein